MATVYLARDLKHDRRVAVKVLRPELAAVLGTERFLRAIQIAARLSHPHILPLHDSGEAAGFLYYVMPYVEGESLRDRLQRGPLPVEESIRLAGEVAGALGYAHAQGIVHRDIKPENILLQAGHAVVTDFGIARAVSAAGGGGPELTRTGVTVGTPLYMSPEQIVGDPVDGRSDLYSLGCVLYEMLTGAPPYSGATSLAVLASHATDPVPSLRQRRPAVSESLERTVVKALAKQPAERFDTAAALVKALGQTTATPVTTPRRRWLGLALAGVVLILLVAGYAVATHRRTPADKSIAVLPLVNSSGTQEDQIRADGMTEALIDALSQVPGLRVPGRMATFVYQGTRLDSREIGSRLHVATMLEGSFQRADAVLQVSVRLINADDGTVLWSDSFRRDQKDVFAFQDEISRAVVRALQVRLAGAAKPLVRRTTENVEAYDLYLKGRWFWNQRAGGAAPLRRAIGFFEQAIALDSNYARAWAGLADVYSLLPAFGDMPPADAFAKAKQAVQRALALDSTLAEAYTSLGIINVHYDWDWPAAARAFDRALALDSTEPRTHLFHAWYYDARGQLEAGLREVRTAQRINPLSPIVNTRVGTSLYYMRRFDAADSTFRQAIELDSTNNIARSELARTLAVQGRAPEAITALPQDLDLQAGYLGGGVSGYVYGRAGRGAEARAIQQQLEQRARERYITPEAFAFIALGMGDTTRALDWLEQGYREHSFYMQFLAVDPLFLPLHHSPRFLKMVRAIGLVFPMDTIPPR